MPKPLRGDGLKTAKEKLEVMAKNEHEVHAVNELKNELEASIYGARDKLDTETLRTVSTEEQREEVLKLCTEIEDWTYEGSIEKHAYEKRLDSLRALLGPVEERATELEARADLPDMIKEALADVQRTKATLKKNMTWVNESKIEKAQEKLTEFTEWWGQRQEKQKALPLSEVPAYTKADVVDRIGQMQKDWEKLKKIKKPKEVKTKDKKETDEKDTKKSEASLPSTVEATEKKLAEVKKAKSDAIENEDFDNAQKLKQEQIALTKHLEQLKATSEEKTEL